MLELHKRSPRTPQEKESLQREIESTDKAIDKLVYELYGLTEEEIKIVEEKKYMSKQMSTADVQNLALSIRQPYAELILRGIKKIEYRTKPTKIRGRVYIYAGLKPGPLEEFEDLKAKPGDFPTGVLVGTVEIVECKKPLFARKYHWLLDKPERLAKPIKADNQAQPIWFIPFAK